MSHPPPAATAMPTTPPTHATPALPLTTKPRGNPDLHLAPRCGARTRAGCSCRAPAIHGKQRCRMHGGRSTGPRTPKGMDSLRAARTIHGAYSAATRARIRHDLTELRRGQVGNAAARCVDLLPADLAARLLQLPPEFLPLPWPTGGLTPAQDRAVLRAEIDALAPWRAAIAQTGLTGWAGKARRAVIAGRPGASAKAHAPVLHRGVPAAAQDAAASTHPTSVHPNAAPKPHAPEPFPSAGSTTSAAPPAAPAAAYAKAHAPERPAAPPASPPRPIAAQSKAPAPEHTLDRRGEIPAAALTAHGGPVQHHAKAHAPDRMAEHRAGDAGGTIPAAAPATHGAAMHLPAKAHAPERGPAPPEAIPPTLPNRAARRRWKSLQRRMHPAPAACSRP
jgi:hypothetical protein